MYIHIYIYIFYFFFFPQLPVSPWPPQCYAPHRPTAPFLSAPQKPATSCPSVYARHVRGRRPRRGNAQGDAQALPQGRCDNRGVGVGTTVHTLQINWQMHTHPSSSSLQALSHLSACLLSHFAWSRCKPVGVHVTGKHIFSLSWHLMKSGTGGRMTGITQRMSPGHKLFARMFWGLLDCVFVLCCWSLSPSGSQHNRRRWL